MQLKANEAPAQKGTETKLLLLVDVRFFFPSLLKLELAVASHCMNWPFHQDANYTT